MGKWGNPEQMTFYRVPPHFAENNTQSPPNAVMHPICVAARN